MQRALRWLMLPLLLGPLGCELLSPPPKSLKSYLLYQPLVRLSTQGLWRWLPFVAPRPATASILYGHAPLALPARLPRAVTEAVPPALGPATDRVAAACTTSRCTARWRWWERNDLYTLAATWSVADPELRLLGAYGHVTSSAYGTWRFALDARGRLTTIRLVALRFGPLRAWELGRTDTDCTLTVVLRAEAEAVGRCPTETLLVDLDTSRWRERLGWSAGPALVRGRWRDGEVTFAVHYGGELVRRERLAPAAGVWWLAGPGSITGSAEVAGANWRLRMELPPDQPLARWSAAVTLATPTAWYEERVSRRGGRRTLAWTAERVGTRTILRVVVDRWRGHVEVVPDLLGWSVSAQWTSTAGELVVVDGVWSALGLAWGTFRGWSWESTERPQEEGEWQATADGSWWSRLLLLQPDDTYGEFEVVAPPDGVSPLLFE